MLGYSIILLALRCLLTTIFIHSFVRSSVYLRYWVHKIECDMYHCSALDYTTNKYMILLCSSVMLYRTVYDVYCNNCEDRRNEGLPCLQ